MEKSLNLFKYFLRLYGISPEEFVRESVNTQYEYLKGRSPLQIEAMMAAYPKEIIMNFIHWSETSQGIDFWHNLYFEFKKFYNEAPPYLK